MNDQTILAPAGGSITAEPIQHVWELPPDLAAEKKRAHEKMLEDLEREEAEWLAKGGEDIPVELKETRKPPPAANPPPAAKPAPTVPSSLTAPPKLVKKSKSVKFEDGSAPRQAELNPTDDWGDVVPATLKGRKPIPKASPVMKFEVVERQPGLSSKQPPPNLADSDDEDEVENNDDASETSSQAWRDQNGEEDSDDEHLVDDDEDENDVNLAAMQEEVAAHYYANRDAVAKQAIPHQSVPLKPVEEMWNREVGSGDYPRNGHSSHALVRSLGRDSCPSSTEGPCWKLALQGRTSAVNTSHCDRAGRERARQGRQTGGWQTCRARRQR